MVVRFWGRLVLLAVSTVLIAACIGQHPTVDALSPSVARPVCPKGGGNYYFPAGVFRYEPGASDAFKQNWYSEFLGVMQEPSLSCGQANVDSVYRFLWLRTSARPISVRISRSVDVVALEAVELSGKGGYEPGTVLRRVRRTLSDTDWEKLETALTRAGFAKLPTVDPSRIGADGAQWTVEGRQKDWYHVVDRWSPNDGPYKELGLLFLQLAEFPATGSRIY